VSLSFFESTIPVDILIDLDIDHDPDTDPHPLHKSWIAEYRFTNPALTPIDSATGEFSLPFIPQNLQADFIPVDYEWHSIKDRIRVDSPGNLEIRIRFPQQNYQGRIKRFRVIGDVADVLEYVPAVQIADTGTVAIYPTKDFTTITGVQITLEDAPSPYDTAAYVKFSIVNSGPDSPYITAEAYNSSDVRVPGIASFMIQGYKL
jgi:hypothetical protein